MVSAQWVFFFSLLAFVSQSHVDRPTFADAPCTIRCPSAWVVVNRGTVGMQYWSDRLSRFLQLWLSDHPSVPYLALNPGVCVYIHIHTDNDIYIWGALSSEANKKIPPLLSEIFFLCMFLNLLYVRLLLYFIIRMAPRHIKTLRFSVFHNHQTPWGKQTQN